MKKILILSFLITSVIFSQSKKIDPKKTEIWSPKPPVVKPATTTSAPSDAIVLFDGSNFDEWMNSKKPNEFWTLNKDGSMTVKDKTGSIKTKRKFGNIQLHIEWKSPAKIQGKGQHRANSGIFLQGRYEIQVLDNNNNDTYANGQVGALYKRAIPLAMASVKTGAWNVYDIIYTAPKFDSKENVTQKATFTVLHNGILIHNNVSLEGPTVYRGTPPYKKHGKGPIVLQDHHDNSRVSYRNIWVRELKD